MRHARPDYDRFQDPLGLIPDDEPVFLIRGSDLAGGFAVRSWASKALELGASENIVNHALAHADAMDAYAEASGKVPDMPE